LPALTHGTAFSETCLHLQRQLLHTYSPSNILKQFLKKTVVVRNVHIRAFTDTICLVTTSFVR
jgi:hypothetical protein